MPDKITEFINSDQITYDALVAGVTLVANTSTESAVVKDIVFRNPLRRPLSLEVGGTSLMKVSDSCRLSGTELVGPGTSLRLKLAGQPTFNGFYFAKDGSNVIWNRCSTLFGSGDSSMSILESTNSVSGSLSGGQPDFICFDQFGNFYYSSGSNLYRRAGGPMGSETSYAFAPYAHCYDGKRYIHAFSSANNIFTFDTQTSAVSSVLCASIGSYGTVGNDAYSSALDGRVYVRPWNGTTSFIVNPTNGAAVLLPSIAESGYRYFVGLGKDDAGNYIAWQTDTTAPQLNWWNLGRDITTPVVNQTGTAYGSLMNSYGRVQAVRQAGSDSDFYIFGKGTCVRFDVRSKQLVNLTPTIGIIPYDGAAYVPAVNTTFSAEDFKTIGVRVTGIKTIP
jgi:hypothetical protein